MEIKLLGTVRLFVDGQPVRLGRKLSALLAALALAGERPVSSSRLIELMYPDKPASTVTLRSHVAHLREVLEPADGTGEHSPTVLLTVPLDAGTAYRLQLGPDDDLDTSRLDDLVGRAKTAMRDGQVDRAGRLARSALELWAGPPDAGLARTSYVAAEIDRLTVLHIDALELNAHSELALGRHRELLDELRVCVVAHPGRAGLHRALMLAAYRSGLRNEALRAYEAGKATLQRLGIDHSTLEPLRRQILAQDSAIDWRPATIPSVRGPIQLPRSVRDFVGRKDEVVDLTKAIAADEDTNAPLVVSVYGMPGVGKTALVNQVANLVQDHFDVVLAARLDSYGPNPYSVLSELLTLLRVLDFTRDTPHDVQSAAALLTSLLSDRRALIVVDDAARAEDVEPFIPAGSDHVVLVTSRSALLDLDGVVAFELDTLSQPDATGLLETFVGARRLAADRAAVQELVAYCGALPLALRIVGAMLRARSTWSIQRFQQWLVSSPTPLGRLKVGDRDLAATLNRSYVALGTTQAQLFRLLGALRPDHVSVEVAAALGALDIDVAENVLQELHEAQLLYSDAPLRFRFHHIVGMFARQIFEEAGEPAAPALERVIGTYLDRMAAMDALLSDAGEVAADGPFANAEEATAWMDGERRNVVTLAGRAELTATETGARSLIRLNSLARRFFDVHSLWEDWQLTADAAVAGARAVQDRAGEGYALCDLGIIAHRRGDVVHAAELFGRAGENLHSAGDRTGEAAVVNNQALTLMFLDDLPGAIDGLTRARSLFRELGDPIREKTTTMNLGEAYRRNGQPAEAIGYLEQALKMAQQSRDAVDEGKTLHNLGEVHREAGDRTRSLDFYRRSLTATDRTGDLHTRALTLFGLGLLAADHHDGDQARGFMSEALVILDDLGSADAEEVRQKLAELID